VSVNRDDYSFPSSDKAVIKNEARAKNLGLQPRRGSGKTQTGRPDSSAVSLDTAGSIAITDAKVKALRCALDKPPVPGEVDAICMHRENPVKRKACAEAKNKIRKSLDKTEFMNETV
jgi:hypothetical protein